MQHRSQQKNGNIQKKGRENGARVNMSDLNQANAEMSIGFSCR